jgi:hypothetical protein
MSPGEGRCRRWEPSGHSPTLVHPPALDLNEERRDCVDAFQPSQAGTVGPIERTLHMVDQQSKRAIYVIARVEP